MREDLRRIRLYFEQLNDWLSDNAGDPNALTVAQGDLRYLLRAANDFASFPNKPSPAANDRFLLENSAVGNAKVYSTLAQLQLALYNVGRTPLYVPPSSHGTLDEEFDVTSVPAGWVFRDTSAGVNRTPTTGTIDPHTAPLINPVVNIHTNGRRSFMSVQLPAGTTFLITKPFTYVDGQYYYANLGTFMAHGSSHGVSCRFGLFKDSGGVPVTTDYVAVNKRDNSGVASINGIVVTTAGGVVTNVIDPMNSGRPYDAVCIQNSGTAASPKWDLYTLDDDGDFQTLVSQDTHTIGTPGWIGWLCVPHASGNVTSTFHFDYVRESVGFPLISKV